VRHTSLSTIEFCTSVRCLPPRQSQGTGKTVEARYKTVTASQGQIQDSQCTGKTVKARYKSALVQESGDWFRSAPPPPRRFSPALRVRAPEELSGARQGWCHLSHPGGNAGANLKSISHICYPILVAFVWELTKKTSICPWVASRAEAADQGRGSARARVQQRRLERASHGSAYPKHEPRNPTRRSHSAEQRRREGGSGFRVLGVGFRVSCFGHRVSGFMFRVSGFVFRVRVPGSGFGFGCRVSGIVFRVSGFVFRVSGFGLDLRMPWERRELKRPMKCSTTTSKSSIATPSASAPHQKCSRQEEPPPAPLQHTPRTRALKLTSTTSKSSMATPSASAPQRKNLC